MALVLKLRSGKSVRIGEAVVRIAYARTGEAKLVIEAPPEVRIERIRREPASTPNSTEDSRER